MDILKDKGWKRKKQWKIKVVWEKMALLGFIMRRPTMIEEYCALDLQVRFGCSLTSPLCRATSTNQPMTHIAFNRDCVPIGSRSYLLIQDPTLLVIDPRAIHCASPPRMNQNRKSRDLRLKQACEENNFDLNLGEALKSYYSWCCTPSGQQSFWMLNLQVGLNLQLIFFRL